MCMIKKRITRLGTNRFLIATTLLLIVAMSLVAIVYPDTFLTQLVETSVAYHVIRAGIGVLLIGLLITYAPRSLVFRLTLGVWALALATTALQLLFTYQMNVLDAVVFTELAIIFGIEALETRSIPIKKPHIPARRIPVTTS